MKAIVTKRFLPERLINFALDSSVGNGAQVADIPIPEITENEVLVKVCAVALNPIDFKDIDYFSPRNRVAGCDYAGQVTKVGKNSAQRWKVGDRIAGFVHGGLYPDVGSFAEYLKVDGDLAWKVPDTMSYAEAATYGVPAATALLALAYLDIPWAGIEKGRDLHTEQSSILIYSGGSNVGLFTIQLAKRAGLKVVVTASPRSFDLVKRYGADAVYDYRSPTAAAEIVKAYPDITGALDCFSEGGSTAFCASVMKKGKVITLLDRGKANKPDIEYKYLMVYTVFGRQFSMVAPLGPTFPAVPSDLQALRQFYAGLPNLCLDVVKPPPITTTQGGFKEIFEGLNKIRKGESRGTKLVVEFE
ncbi:zinc-binding alcohol dehydrogenase family protein [Aspergillus novofumigatus IBT 16806]|uniref:Putative zinc-binding dehydrogenase family oxidoreductase n=1 Tax=Aspergillus novofumigatus (strain IBT 16806) TaxID=1392255 RepID=A0A2I1CEC6_ASPN1|nr:putative zinc-binding dehydrogenase family oxidoreductase [Aspergillus novofumigatus IBT 16806]PKX95979.1 putative zinc-binding dehydrogenase family oxidoreductase [Aspergillus novofumigatus IBT 16806]